MRTDDPFSMAILAELAAAPSVGGMSLPRLAKRLDLGVSVVLRQLSMMGDAVIGGQPGPAWVRVVQTEDRWVVHLTDGGRIAAESLLASPDTREPAEGHKELGID
jgi:hypothetical protein